MLTKFIKLAIFATIAAQAKKQGEDGYEGFPVPGKSHVVVGNQLYKITDYLGQGPKKRAYRAKKVGPVPPRLPAQDYAFPSAVGETYMNYPLPDEVVVKCSATDQPKRKNKLEDEYQSLLFLNALRSVRKPIGLYLSKQWKCFDNADFVCQYMVMTQASPDLRKLIENNVLNLKPPMVEEVTDGAQSARGRHSFELFMATFALSLMGELEKLHAVGLVHRDMSVKNVALEPTDRTLVYLIDMGSSSFLTKYSSAVDKVERLVDRDFARVKRVAMQLISTALMAADKQADVTKNELYALLDTTASKWDLRMALLNYLQKRFPNVRFDGRIIYQ